MLGHKWNIFGKYHNVIYINLAKPLCRVLIYIICNKFTLVLKQLKKMSFIYFGSKMSSMFKLGKMKNKNTSIYRSNKFN